LKISREDFLNQQIFGWELDKIRRIWKKFVWRWRCNSWIDQHSIFSVKNLFRKEQNLTFFPEKFEVPPKQSSKTKYVNY
jgi:hypothetical protein